MANHEIVPGSAFTNGTAERRNPRLPSPCPASPGADIECKFSHRLLRFDKAINHEGLQNLISKLPSLDGIRAELRSRLPKPNAEASCQNTKTGFFELHRVERNALRRIRQTFLAVSEVNRAACGLAGKAHQLPQSTRCGPCRERAMVVLRTLNRRACGPGATGFRPHGCRNPRRLPYRSRRCRTQASLHAGPNGGDETRGNRRRLKNR